MSNYLTARGWLTQGEREILVRYAAAVSSVSYFPCIVNIGVEYGASLHCLKAGAPQSSLHGVDLDISKFEGDTVAALIRGDSTDPDTAAKMSDRIDLLFIDGGHSYNVVLSDISLWTPKVSVGGFVLFHDYSDLPMHAGVLAAVNMWESIDPSWKYVESVDTIRAYQRR